MAEKFKAGDIVECIEGSLYSVKGKRYVVKDCAAGFLKFEGETWSASQHRFKKVGEENMQNTVALNGITYKVEYIPGKGDCLVPVIPVPEQGEVWIGPKGGVYIVAQDLDEHARKQGFELKSMRLYPIPPTATKATDYQKQAALSSLIK